jgi:protein-L-isoaspartate(D-aspartate) O-methyltransferase
MARTTSERLRRSLIADMHAKGALSSPGVTAAFLAVAREHFLPEALAKGGLKAVYRDDAIATKRNDQGLPLSSSSQPSLMAMMLELLDVQPGDRVLEVGAGTGYNAALLAHLTGPSGRVTSIDIDPDIARRARRSLRDAGVGATIVAGDGRDGHPPKAPYDRIIATAAADEIPRAWLEQLNEAGRLVLPLRLDRDGGAIQLIPVFERFGDQLRSVGMTWGGFMPLHGGDGGWNVRPSTLSAFHSVDGHYTGLASLSGHGVGQLSSPGARGLLVSLLTKPGTPQRRGLTDLASEQPPLLLLHLLLNIPAKQRLSLNQPGRWGIGIVDRRSQSAAIVSLRSPWGNADTTPQRRARWRLDAYGADTAAAQLDELITQWQQLEHAGQTKLRITARGRASELRLTFAWDESYG